MLNPGRENWGSHGNVEFENEKKVSIYITIPTNFSDALFIVCYPPKDKIQYVKYVFF